MLGPKPSWRGDSGKISYQEGFSSEPRLLEGELVLGIEFDWLEAGPMAGPEADPQVRHERRR